jgi:hypothetical protein
MLDILRKHASSWLIKVILGAIVISFIFFFGYSRATRNQRRGGGDGAVGTVDGRPLPAAEYKFFLDRNFERMRASFEGKEVPEFVRKMARNATMQQLIGRTIALDQAQGQGVVVPDEELIAQIRQTAAAQKDGEFDPIFYKHEFLPYFHQRYGLDFEAMLKEDLELERFEGLYSGVDQKTPDGMGGGSTSWTFEVVAIEPSKMLERKAIKSADEARSLAGMLVSQDPKSWRAMLATFGVQPKKVGPIKVAERASILDGRGEFDDYMTIFSLTPEKPVIARPIERGGNLYVVRLVESSGGDEAPPWPRGDFYRAWMTKLSDEAKVTSFLKEED